MSSPSDGDSEAPSLAPVPHGSYFTELPLDSISPNPRQPRTAFDEEAMNELVESIREVGMLQPIVVRPLGGARFELVMGERRWRAAQQADLDNIPAIVRETADASLPGAPARLIRKKNLRQATIQLTRHLGQIHFLARTCRTLHL